MLLGEKELLQKLKNPFIVETFYTFETSDKYYFLMEYLGGGRLFYHLKLETRFPESKVKFYIA